MISKGVGILHKHEERTTSRDYMEMETRASITLSHIVLSMIIKNEIR